MLAILICTYLHCIAVKVTSDLAGISRDIISKSAGALMVLIVVEPSTSMENGWLL